MLIEFNIHDWKHGIQVDSYGTSKTMTFYWFNKPTRLPTCGYNNFVGIVKTGKDYYLAEQSFADKIIPDFKVTSVIFTK